MGDLLRVLPGEQVPVDGDAWDELKLVGDGVLGVNSQESVWNRVWCVFFFLGGGGKGDAWTR